MPRLLVSEISVDSVSGHIEGSSDVETLATSLDGTSFATTQTTNDGAFTLSLPEEVMLTGQTLAIWLKRDPTIHIVVPLWLGPGDSHALEDEVKLLRAELELVKTALRRVIRSQGQG